MTQDTAKARYAALRQRREPFLRRARECAALTIPSLLPPEGFHGSMELPQPYQGLGARCVSYLASRITTAVFPPGKPFFRLQIPSEVLLKQGMSSPPADLEQNLSLTERMIHAEVERRQWRSPTNLVLQHLITTGNTLAQMLPDNRIRLYRLDQYCIVRDPAGNVTEIVIEEQLAPTSLPEAYRALVNVSDVGSGYVSLFTWVKKTVDGWSVSRELNDKKIPGPKGSGVYKISPFIPLRWSAVVGEDYGRGKVEEHLADFRAIDGLQKAVLDGAAMASRNITMVAPNAAGGLNLRRRIAMAKNGEIVVGNAEDVQMLQFQNAGGMQFTAQELGVLKQELSSAFLLGSGARRDAERVTAAEVRMVAEELEGTLGGVYSTLGQELVMPLLARLIVQMQDAKPRPQLPAWPDGVIEPTILTGLEALGREQEVQSVATVLQFMQGLPPEIVQMYPKWTVLLGRVFNGVGLSDAVHSEAEVQQLQQQQAMMQAMAQAGPQMMAEGGAPPAAAQATEGGAAPM